MRGTALECFKHFYDARLPPRDAQTRTLFVKAVGVASFNTVRSWYIGENKPIGEALLRLRYLLEFFGYEVVDLEIISEPVRNLGRLIAFGALEIDEAAKELGFNRHAVLRIIMGRGQTVLKRQGKIDELVKAFESELPKLQEQYTALRPATLLSQANNGLEKPLAAVEPELAKKPADVLAVLANLIKALEPLATEVASDRFTPAQRKRLRELTGDYTLFYASSALNQLCGETAREVHKPKQPRREACNPNE